MMDGLVDESSGGSADGFGLVMEEGGADRPIRRRATLAWRMVEEPFARFLIQSAAREIVPDAATPFPGTLVLKPGYEAFRIQGLLAPRAARGRALPRWCYALVLRAAETPRPILLAHGHHALGLKVGMLVEFDQKRRHRIDQRAGEFLIWAPVFSKKRLSLEEALAAHRAAFADGLLLASGSASSEIYGAGHCLVHDGAHVRVLDPTGLCLAYFDARGFALCRRRRRLFDVDTEYLMKAHRRPRPADWARLRTLLRTHFGIEIPSTAMPRWLRA